jgi:hypothetical protein
MFGEVSKTLGRNFLVANFVPMALLVGANMLLVAAGLLRPIDPMWIRAFGLSEPLATLAVLALLSVGLQQAGRTILRLFEGYYGLRFFWVAGIIITCLVVARVGGGAALTWGDVIFLPAILATVGTLHPVFRRYHRWRFARWQAKIDQLKKEASEANDANVVAAKKRQALLERRELARQYPLQVTLVLPTRFGNILRSFEHHPRHLYNIAPISGWARLLAVIPENFKALLEEQETNVLFLVNLVVVFLLLGAELFALRPAAPQTLAALATLTLPLAYATYRLACSAASIWGEFVRSAFDLYRLDLLKQLGVDVPPHPITLADERKLWRQVERLTFEIEKTGDDLRFLPRTWAAKELVRSSVPAMPTTVAQAVSAPPTTSVERGPTGDEAN